MARVSVAVSATRVSARAPAASSVARRARPVRSPRSVALRRGVGVSRRSSSSGGVPEPQPRVSPLDADAASLPEPSTNAASFDEFSVGQTDFVAETRLPTDRGFYRVRGYRHSVDGGHPTEPLAICHGDIEGREGVPVRVHDACFTSETLGSMKCDCKQQLEMAMDYIKENGPGIVCYLQQEGRGIGLANKIAAYAVQEEGVDTVDANRRLGLPDDTREYTAVENMLRELDVRSVQLMTNNPRKIRELECGGIKITGRIACVVKANLFNEGYLAAKERRMSHVLDQSWAYWDAKGNTYDSLDEMEGDFGDASTDETCEPFVNLNPKRFE